MALSEADRAALRARAAGLRAEVTSLKAAATDAVDEASAAVEDARLLAEVERLERVKSDTIAQRDTAQGGLFQKTSTGSFKAIGHDTAP